MTAGVVDIRIRNKCPARVVEFLHILGIKGKDIALLLFLSLSLPHWLYVLILLCAGGQLHYTRLLHLYSEHCLYSPSQTHQSH